MPHAIPDTTSLPNANNMSRPSSTSTSSAAVAVAAAAPRPTTGANTLLAPEPIGEQLSPSRSTFSFESSPKSVQAAENTVQHDDARIIRPATAMAAIAARNPPTSGGPVVQSTGGGSRRRAQYYEEQFAYKDDTVSSARDRVTKDAPIVAELRTNVIIKDEYTLVTDLSHHLAVRYQRPESSIMITVSHSACLLLGGSFEPTYVLSITALPVQLQPTTNKRNAALIQAFMFESIGVATDRGIIKFLPIEPECFATNGSTLFGEIERLQRQSADENGGLKRALTKGSRRSAVSKAKSSFQLSRNDSKANAPARTTITPPLPSPGPFDSGVAVDQGTDVTQSHPAVTKPLNKSSMKSPSSKRTTDKQATFSPNVQDNSQQPKISKRKSLAAMFRR
ncbi:unnamed protein product [Periconia digitata]|uniref:L-dopachrome isomerase n=1 Tax=Periconia digitata TaxID=1303443 RepID=A0A9W4UIB3_9PLEO|nr:unnamed protein product [Periconia digitata]